MKNANRIKKTRSNKKTVGSTIVLALAVLTPVMVAGGNMLSAISSYGREVDGWVGRSTARAIAASGAHDALWQLDQNPYFSGEYEHTSNGGQALVTVNPLHLDDIDNNGNGAVDEADESALLSIRSEGWLGGDTPLAERTVSGHMDWFRSVVIANARRVYLGVPVNQAIYIDEPFAELDLRTKQWRVSGYDSTLSGEAGDEEPVRAIGTPGIPETLLSQIPLSVRSQFQSETEIVAPTPKLDMNDIIDMFSSAANTKFDDGTAKIEHGELGDIDFLKPEITVASGNLEIQGITTGAGILIVNGDLKIEDDFRFAGVILALGKVELKCSGEILGGLLIQGEPDEVALKIDGNLQIKYSTEALAPVQSKFFKEGVLLLTWEQDVEADLPAPSF